MANNNSNKWGRMETEMDRFEAEISSLSKTSGAGPQLPPGVGGGSGTSTAHSFLPASLRKQPQQQLPQSSSMLRPTLLKPSVIISGAPQVYGSPATLGLRPTQLLPKSVRPVGTPPSQIIGSPINHHSLHNSPVQAGGGSASLESSPFHPHPPPPSVLQSPTSSSGSTPTSSQASSSATNSKSTAGTKKKKKKTQKSGSGEGGSSKPKKVLRAAGGTVWEDPTLMDWDPKDFRLFCGDLGNDVTDEVLTRVFGRYPSFVKAKVVRDKRTNKTRGYGFVSFKDPNDFVRAMRELDGRYVGSRPIKLRKSTWDARSLTQVRKREKHQKQLLGLIKP